MTDGFEVASTETLQRIRANLLRGLDRVAAALADGTFDAVGPKGSAPPSQSGNLTLALLAGVDRELERRTPPMPVPTAVIVDIDGTLATRVTDRSPYDWQRVGEDAPVAAVVTTVRALHAAGLTILVMSGRDEECRAQTESWLLHHLGVEYDLLLMRRAKDNRRDDVVKRELFERHVADRYEVAFTIDDREQVVRMWREELGLVCFQVAPGNF